MGSVDNVYSHKSAHEDVSHQAISSYFIGPQAENMPYFKDNITTILDELVAARLKYFPQDGVNLSPGFKQKQHMSLCVCED